MIGNPLTTDVIIPNNINGYIITNIIRHVFRDNKVIKSIYIPNSVTSIGSNGFQFASSLKTVTFEENSQLTSIGSFAFYDADSLESIIIPNSVTSIGSSAFKYTDCLTIYAEASEKPSGWDSNWNSSNRPVIWGYEVK